MDRKIVVIMVKGVCNLTSRQKSFASNLKLRKNTLRVIKDDPVHRGILSKSNLFHWAILPEDDELFHNTQVTLHLNNPKRGHIYKDSGRKEYQLFKRQFIDRMYLRL